jgi:hypothetical protein
MPQESVSPIFTIPKKRVEEYSDIGDGSKTQPNFRKSFSVFSNGLNIAKYKRGESLAKNSEEGDLKQSSAGVAEPNAKPSAYRSINVTNFNEVLSFRGRNQSTKETRVIFGKSESS